MQFDEVQSLVRETILANGGSQVLVDKVIKDLAKAAEEERADRAASKGPKAKHDFVVLLSDPEGKLAGLQAIPAWVFQVAKDCPPQTIVDRVKAAAVTFNNSRKGRRAPATTVGQAIEVIPAKWWKADDGTVTRVKTKLPSWAVVTNNKL